MITDQPMVSECWVIEGPESSADTPLGLNQIHHLQRCHGFYRTFVDTTGLG